jgi:DHA1 family bicyclomycin/chloramphenicol resistance-like MFS transporter
MSIDQIVMKKTLSKTMILFTIILMEILAGAELDLFVPSFPQLQAQFDLTPFWVEALLSINFAGLCLSLFFIGALADNYGRKPIIIIGLIIFIVGSILCLYASSYWILLLGRFLQGVGISAPGTLGFLIIADNYPIKEQQFMLSMLNGVVNASVGAAPVIGSYITLYFHWQGNFTALLIGGIICFVMAVLFIPPSQLPEQKETLSFKGYLPIFQSKPLVILMTSLVFLFAPYWVFVGISPLLYIKNLGVSLTHFGYYQGVFCVVFALGSVLFGFIMHRFDEKKILRTGWCIVAFSLVCLGCITILDTPNPLLITLAFLMFVIGQIIPASILYPVSLNMIPSMKGRVSALMQGFKLILTAVCLQVAGYFYTGSFQNIGIILCAIIFVGLLTLFYVVKNTEPSF